MHSAITLLVAHILCLCLPGRCTAAVLLSLQQVLMLPHSRGLEATTSLHSAPRLPVHGQSQHPIVHSDSWERSSYPVAL